MNYKWSANGRQMRGYVEQIQAKVCSKREAMSEKRPVFGGGEKASKSSFLPSASIGPQNGLP